MIKITAKEIGEYLKVTPGYIRCLLSRRKIALKQDQVKEVLDILVEKKNATTPSKTV